MTTPDAHWPIFNGAILWSEIDVNGTALRGFLSGLPYRFEETVARLKALSGQDPTRHDGDEMSVEFSGTFFGQRFTLYDYMGDRAIHIGGSPHLNVEWLKTALWEGLATVAPMTYAARVPSAYGGETHGWQ